MGKVHVGDLLRIGHKLWYRIGCGPGMPGPYRVAGGRLVVLARCAGGMYAAPTDNPLGGWLRWVCGRVESLPYGFKMKGMQ